MLHIQHQVLKQNILIFVLWFGGNIFLILLFDIYQALRNPYEIVINILREKGIIILIILIIIN